MDISYSDGRTVEKHTPGPWEAAARAAGWEHRYSHFTRCGVSIAYVDWNTLCQEENIAIVKAEGRD